MSKEWLTLKAATSMTTPLLLLCACPTELTGCCGMLVKEFRFTAGDWVLTGCFCACALSQGSAIFFSDGALTVIDCTFVSSPGSTVYVSTGEGGVTTRIFNSTFTKDTSTAGHHEFIYTSGTYVDYGNCTPGWNPGPSGTNILVADGSFTGCPFACPLGTWGRGGPTTTLREMQTGCGVGCETCPEGAVCNATALPAPNYCPVGHYNPDGGSQTAGGCRECERCVIELLHAKAPSHHGKLNTTRVCRAQWVFPSGDCFPPVHSVRTWHLLSDQGQHCLPGLRHRWLLRGGGCELRLRLQAVPDRHLVGHNRPQQQRGLLPLW